MWKRRHKRLINRFYIESNQPYDPVTSEGLYVYTKMGEFMAVKILLQLHDTREYVGPDADDLKPDLHDWN